MAAHTSSVSHSQFDKHLIMTLSHQPSLWLPILSSSGVQRRRPSSCCRTYCWQTFFTHQLRTCLVIITHTLFQSPLYHCIYTLYTLCHLSLSFIVNVTCFPERNLSYYFLSTLNFALWVRPVPFYS